MDATLTYRSVRRVRQGLVALALGMTAMAGCQQMQPSEWREQANCQACASSKPGEPPAPAPSPAPPPQPGQVPKTVSAYWERQLKSAPDTQRNGENVPGLVGRMFLFDQKDHMLCYDGTLTVKLYDEKPVQGGQEVFLEQWNFDKDSLRRLQRKDGMIGWGYTIFLPTATCTNPNVKFIRVVASFVPEGKDKDVPIVVANSMRLEHPEVPQRQQVQPTQYHQAPGVAPVGYGPSPGYPPQQAPMGYYPQQQPYVTGPMPPQGQMPQYAQPQYPQQQPQMPLQYQQPQMPLQYQQPQMPTQPPQYPQQQMPQYPGGYPQQPAPQYPMQQQPAPQYPMQQPAPQGLQQQPYQGGVQMPPTQQQSYQPMPQQQAPAPGQLPPTNANPLGFSPQ
jgi:hypothetical protein